MTYSEAITITLAARRNARCFGQEFKLDTDHMAAFGLNVSKVMWYVARIEHYVAREMAAADGEIEDAAK